jgi:hypothetical protein
MLSSFLLYRLTAGGILKICRSYQIKTDTNSNADPDADSAASSAEQVKLQYVWKRVERRFVEERVRAVEHVAYGRTYM